MAKVDHSTARKAPEEPVDVEGSTTVDCSFETRNPHFRHVERAPYELGKLLQQLPAVFTPYTPAPTESVLVAEAAAQHAENANETIMRGIAAIGDVLVSASGNEDAELGRDSVRDLGALLQHLAVEAQFLQHTRRDLTFTLRKLRE